PTELDGGRFIAVPVTTGGERLRILLDTGGNNVLFADAVARLGLEPVTIPGHDGPRDEVPFPAMRAGAAIPAPTTRDGRVLAMKRPDWMPLDGDGILGPEWF